jgi:hypothetical protein
MSSAVRLLETLLQHKKLDGTLARAGEQLRLARTGLAALDGVLGGGWPNGAISELIGPRSSGKTRALMASLAVATAGGQMVALVDALDRLDPRSAADAGVDLSRVLWIRGAPLTVELSRPALVDRAIRQAVRAFDLAIRAGGFAIVALDLADIPPRRLQALPSVTWLRLAHANEGRDTVGLVVGEVSLGRSARGITVGIEARPIWTGTSAQSRRLAGMAPAFVRRSGGLRPSYEPPVSGALRAAGQGGE